MNKGLLGLLVLVSVFALVCPVLAQPGAGPGQTPPEMPAGTPGMGAGPGIRQMKGRPMYNPQTVTAVKGTVLSTGAMPGKMGRTGMGMQSMLVKTDQGNVQVLLGPKPYLDQQPFTPKPGDTVEVTGSQFTRKNQKMIMAREVKADGNTLVLRNEQGVPLWAGKMGRGGGKTPSAAGGYTAPPETVPGTPEPQK